jgi:hypothetical protein
MPDWRESHFGVAGRPPVPRRRWWPVVVFVPLLAVGGVYSAIRLGMLDAAAMAGLGTAESDPARARQLRERVASQERGIALMSRERLEVDEDRALQQRLLVEAVARLRQLEGTSTSGMTPIQVDRLRVAHGDAVAAAKNATTRTRQLDTRRDSLDRRIATAERERDAALTELGEKPVVAE